MSRSRLTIRRRLVRNVALAMLMILLVTSGFVFWRVEHALDRQLDRDLNAYSDAIIQAVARQNDVADRAPGEWYQVYDRSGRVTLGSTKVPLGRLVPVSMLRATGSSKANRLDRGSIFRPGTSTIRVQFTDVTTRAGQMTVATAISRRGRDEALRELLGQLALAGVLTLIGASYVGYRTARGALDPVERYRLAAGAAGEAGGTRLPVDADRDDELTRLGHTLNDLLDRLASAAERERQYLADASHELRTPLTLLKAEVEVALHQPRDTQYMRQVLVSVAGEVDRMAALANALLDLEELESGIQSSVSTVDVAALVGRSVERYAPAFERVGRALTVRAQPALARLSEPWIDVAVRNLLSNALVHGEGAVTVEVVTEHDTMTISVSDEGPGIAATLRSTAFNRFTRGDLNRTTRGSGLGLSLVRSVAEAHGGHAAIRDLPPSSPHPTCVTIRLPIR
ncbi:MAG: Signal transduction histidine kinase [Aeromicrobium sp.]|nr:Signal transduction histidine kinase [Aeromicrobium sp.]